MLATLLIWLSAAVAALKVVDIFLSKAQKDWLSDALVKLWNILDEAKGWSFADWLKEPRAAWWLAVSCCFFIGGIFIMAAWSKYVDISEIKEIEAREWALIGIVLAFALFIGFVFTMWLRYIFRQLLDSRSGEFLKRRSTEIALFLPINIVAWTLTLMAVGYFWTDPSLFRTFIIEGIKAVRGMQIWMLCCLLWIFFARALAYLARIILYIGEFLVRRIAEYPKGPVLTMSAVIGGIATLISRAFG